MRRSCRPGQSSARAPSPRRLAQSRLTVLFSRINFIKQSVRAPRPASARPAVPLAAGLAILLARVRTSRRRARQIAAGVIAARPFNSLCTAHSQSVSQARRNGRVEMTTKRKRERENDSDIRMKRTRRRKRSSSEPGLLYDPVNAKKRQVLKRLFGRNCNSTFEGESSTSSSESFPRPNIGRDEIIDEDETFDREESPVREDLNDNTDYCDEFPEDNFDFENENSDPLLDSVPVDLDPEQLGFLVCAQETLRFLNRRGFAFEHPVFTRLRSRLLRGMDELAVA